MDLIKLQTFGTAITLVTPENTFPNDVLEHSVVIFEVERSWLEKHFDEGKKATIEEYLKSYDLGSTEWLFQKGVEEKALKTISFMYHHL